MSRTRACSITGMVNPQVVRTAEMMDMKCIIFVRGKVPGEDILELAREENIPVLVTIAPYFLVDEKSERLFNRVGEIAGEYGDLFLDGNKLVDEIGVDYQVDNADDVGHLNYLGNQKYTKYLGTYIKEHYTVSDRRADAAYESWQKTRTISGK